MHSPSRMRRLLISVLLSILIVPVVHAFNVPLNDGYITDEAGILSDTQEQTLEQSLEEYRTNTSNEIAVLIIQSLSGADLTMAAVDTARNWGVGTKEKSNGVLMFIALQDRALTIQVGYGLEGALPDIVVKGIIDEEILPAFRDGDYFEGIEAGVDAIEKHIGGEYTADRYTGTDTRGSFTFFMVFFLVMLNFLSAWLARSKGFWTGGVVGAVFGVVLWLLYSWIISLPFFIVVGLMFDYWVSHFPNARRRRGGDFWGGGGSGRGSGGFGGFGGGSFGGGGASGKW